MHERPIRHTRRLPRWAKRLAAAAALAVAGCDGGNTAPPPSSADAPPAAAAAPAADSQTPAEPRAASLPRIDGPELRALIDTAADNGRVVVIDFWATWCVPCIELFPELHPPLKAMGDTVRPVTVSLDAPGEYEEQAVAFLRKHGAMADAYLFVPNTDRQLEAVELLGEQWNDLVVPAILVFDARGNLAGEFFGGEAQPVIDLVRSLTAEREPASRPTDTPS